MGFRFVVGFFYRVSFLERRLRDSGLDGVCGFVVFFWAKSSGFKCFI